MPGWHLRPHTESCTGPSQASPTRAPPHAPQTPSFLLNFPPLTDPRCPSHSLNSFPRPHRLSTAAKNTTPEPFQDTPLPLLPSVPFTPLSLLPREILQDWHQRGVEVGRGFGGADGTFWVPNQQHQPLPGGVKAVPIVGCDLVGGGMRKRAEGWGEGRNAEGTETPSNHKHLNYVNEHARMPTGDPATGVPASTSMTWRPRSSGVGVPYRKPGCRGLRWV